MRIDESLANGLTKQLIEQMDKDFVSAKEIYYKKITVKMHSSRNGFDKVASIHQDTFKQFTLSQHVGGSKRHPYIGEIVLSTKNDRKYKEWDEGSVFGMTTILPLSPQDETKDSNPSLFIIGEHAISRIFQRSHIFDDADKIEPYLIIPELSLIPFWSCFWSQLLQEMSQFSFEHKSKITPVIPSPHGLFFCKVTNYNTAPIIEVRTFVHESSLTDTQKQVRLMLLNTSKNIENSIMCLYPYHLSAPNKDRSHFEYCIVLMLTLIRMKGETYQLCETLLPEKNTFEVYKLDRIINELIEECHISEDERNSQNDELNKQGYRLWLTNYIEKLMQFKNR